MTVKVLRPKENLVCIFFTLESGMQFQVNSPNCTSTTSMFQSEHIGSTLVKKYNNLSDIALSVSLSVQLEMSMLTQCGN